jgi:hypothetical protein
MWSLKLCFPHTSALHRMRQVQTLYDFDLDSLAIKT